MTILSSSRPIPGCFHCHIYAIRASARWRSAQKRDVSRRGVT